MSGAEPQKEIIKPKGELVTGKVDPKTYAPRAWVIADFSGDSERRQEFELSTSPDRLRRSISKGVMGFEGLTNADRFVKVTAPDFEVDPIGGEDFLTVYEARMKNVNSGAAVSLHKMILGARETQRFHYHPPSGTPADPTTSIRQVILYPLHNLETGEGGITFEWFALKKPGIQRDDGDIYPKATGTPIGDRHIVKVDPGQVVMVEFGQGVHRFSGLGYALSAHFHDREHGGSSRLGSFLGNTATWVERDDEPQNERLVRKSTSGNSGGGLQETFNTLSGLIAYHQEVLRHRLETHTRLPRDQLDWSLHPNTRTAIINDLRAE